MLMWNWTDTSLLAANLFQHRQQILDEPGRVLAHRKMPEALHDRRFRAGALRHVERGLGGAGIIIFAGQEIKRRGAAVDLVDPAADVAIDLVEMQVALEHAGTAL